jgi:hypothetical protein
LGVVGSDTIGVEPDLLAPWNTDQVTVNVNLFWFVHVEVRRAVAILLTY